MAIFDETFAQRVQRWASGSATGGEGDPIVTETEIQDFLDTQFETWGTLYMDLEDLPVTAEERQQVFTNEVDAFRHWVTSGLVVFDEDGNIKNNPMIAIVKQFDEMLGDYTYTVYIDYED